MAASLQILFYQQWSSWYTCRDHRDDQDPYDNDNYGLDYNTHKHKHKHKHKYNRRYHNEGGDHEYHSIRQDHSWTFFHAFPTIIIEVVEQITLKK